MMLEMGERRGLPGEAVEICNLHFFLFIPISDERPSEGTAHEMTVIAAKVDCLSASTPPITNCWL